MAKFTYNNTKNASISHMLFKRNCSYYLHFFFKKDINFSFHLKKTDKLLAELSNLMIMCRKNFYHTQEF